MQAHISILQPQFTQIQAEIFDINQSIKDAERDLRNIKKNKGIEEAKIPNSEAELEQVVDNCEKEEKKYRRCKKIK